MPKSVTITFGGTEGKWTRTWENPADEYTDKKLAEVTRRLRMIYQQAVDDLELKQWDFRQKHEKRVEMYRAQVDAGLLSQADYEAWMQGQLFQERAWALKRGQMARMMADVDRQAMRLINTGRLEVFGENADWMLFQIESDLGAFGTFGLFDEKTMARLILEKPWLLPMQEVDEEKDIEWYNDVITRAVTQGILQGETLDEICLRVAEETGEKALNVMRRNARTAFTSAQGAGRQEAMIEARDRLGIDIKKRWYATLDDKTRDAHGDLDGKTADLDEPFESPLGPIMFPGDPTARPANVWNCRCRLGRSYGKYDVKISRIDVATGENVGAMTYKEWRKMHTAEGEAT